MSYEEATFTAHVQRRHRVVLPRAVREALGIKVGDYVEIKIKRLKPSPVGMLRR